MLSVIADILLKVTLTPIKRFTILYIKPYILLKVVLNTKKKQLVTMLYELTMLYIITDILLKVALSSNKTGHHVIRYIL